MQGGLDRNCRRYRGLKGEIRAGIGLDDAARIDLPGESAAAIAGEKMNGVSLEPRESRPSSLGDPNGVSPVVGVHVKMPKCLFR